MAAIFTDVEMLRLYEIETRQVHAALDHILRIRGMMGVAFAALLSVTLYYQKGFIALGGVVFLGAWYWEYIYARYMGVYVRRVEALQVWIAQKTGDREDVSAAFAPGSGYDHRLTNRLFVRFGFKDPALLRLATFFDIPRMIVYLSISLAPIVTASVLGFPWT